MMRPSGSAGWGALARPSADAPGVQAVADGLIASALCVLLADADPGGVERRRVAAHRLAAHLWDLARVSDADGGRDRMRKDLIYGSQVVREARALPIPAEEFAAGVRTLWLDARRRLRRLGR